MSREDEKKDEGIWHKNCNYLWFLNSVCNKCGQYITEDLVMSHRDKVGELFP